MKRWALKTLLITSILTLGMAKVSFGADFYVECLNSCYIDPSYGDSYSVGSGYWTATTTGSLASHFIGDYGIELIYINSNYPTFFFATSTVAGGIWGGGITNTWGLYQFTGVNIYAFWNFPTNTITGANLSTSTAINRFSNYGYSGSIAGDLKFYSDVSSRTRIISVIPASNATVIPFTATSTQRFADFDIDSLEYYNDTSVSSSTIAVINTYLTNNNITSYQYTKSFTGSFGSGFSSTSYNIAQDVPFGNYDINISFLNSDLQLITSTSSTNITFGSSTNAITFQEAYGASSSNPFDISQIATSSACGITDLTGCFKNALVWAFYPNMDLIKSQISNLKGSIQNKPPFGYFTILQTSMNNLNASGTAIFNIIIPDFIRTSIFDPLKTALIAIFWFVGGVWLYNRMKHIQL
ncbi:MAG: hypothetical protein WC389_17275 [Lutibacter sp.]|jgi:hypothetical protein